ncbi:MAG: PEP-CTERM sorting domain-containing protein [Bryobacteraceae bacterium]|nr:PEP-CTERM sorting domain-containing protein [Bryobacteraceae bacterium]
MARRLTRLLIIAAFLPVLLGAATVTYTVQNTATFSGFFDSDLSATYAGTGYVGLWGPTTPDPGFVRVFGLEGSALSRVALQIDISALIGQTIQSAMLSFLILQNPGEQVVTATSFEADGTLGYYFDPPSDLGTATYTLAAQASQTLDVTSLLAARVASGSTWFGLHLAGTLEELAPYTPAFDFDILSPAPDAAQVRLTVETASGVTHTPEPSAALLLAGGLIALGLWRRQGLNPFRIS